MLYLTLYTILPWLGSEKTNVKKMFCVRLVTLIQIRVDFTKSWLFCMAPTWTGICLAVILRDGWLHGPPTCVKTCWTFLKISCHSGHTVLANRVGWRVAGDLVPGKWEVTR